MNSTVKGQGKGKPHDWQDTNTASNQMEPAEPDHKRVKRRQTVWVAYLQTKERPNSVPSGSRVHMGALRRRHIPAVALSRDLLRQEMLRSQWLVFIITNIYSKYKIRAGGWIKKMCYTLIEFCQSQRKHCPIERISVDPQNFASYPYLFLGYPQGLK